jgi:hypothetical protein
MPSLSRPLNETATARPPQYRTDAQNDEGSSVKHANSERASGFVQTPFG